MDSQLQVALLSPPVFFVLGLLIGSFLNVVIHRIPLMDLRSWWRFDIVDYALTDDRAWRPVFGDKSVPPPQLQVAAASIRAELTNVPEVSLLRPRSRCPHCGHVLHWYENVPVLSWLWLRGRCSSCKTAVSPRYPLVELLTAALFGACAAAYGPTPAMVLFCTVLALLIVKSFIDLAATLLPEGLTLSLIGLGALGALAGWTSVTPTDSLAGALAGFLVLWLPGTFWKVVLKKDAMGAGDMKMLAGLGALFGWQALPLLLFAASVIGVVVGLAFIAVSGRGRETKISFGPFLAIAGVACVFLRPEFTAFGNELARAFS